MNLIFVKNLGFSIVCERFPIYISGGGRSPTMFYPRLSKMGLRPISSGAVRPPPAPLLLCLHPHRNLCAATSVATPSRSFQGLEGIMIRCIGIAYAGDGNPPEVPRSSHCLWCVPHDICKMSSGYTSLLEWGLKGRSPL